MLNLFGNTVHYAVQPGHVHYTGVMLSHVRVSLGLGLEELSLKSKPDYYARP